MMIRAIASSSSLLPTLNSVGPIASALVKEWTWLTAARPNVLLVGDRIATDAALDCLQPTCQPPVIVQTCGNEPLMLPPSGSVNTFVLHDVATLSPGDQQMLADWLSHERLRPQVVTTSSVPLFPLVRSGAFLETLYYRLNVIYAEVRSSSPSR
jgi:hypothetical protein